MFDELHYISAGKLRRYHGESWVTKLLDVKTNLLNIRDVFRLGAGLIQSYFLIKRLKADSLLLKGGFVCVPVALAARAHKVPYVTHDSDALPGLSNRIAARWATYHATAMPAKYYSYPQESIRVVGVPTDSRFRPYSQAEQAILREKYAIASDAQVILITGGSNGARRLNETFLATLPKLTQNVPNLFVLHQLGAGNEDQIKLLATDTKSHTKFFDFTNELFHMSAIADIVITRAGATAMADLGIQGKACVVVPNPFLAGGHQLKNAQVYAEAEAAVIVPEGETETLYNAIEGLLQDPQRRAILAQNLHKLVPPKSAAISLAELLEESVQQ